jgi:hypothetical protein
MLRRDDQVGNAFQVGEHGGEEGPAQAAPAVGEGPPCLAVAGAVEDLILVVGQVNIAQLIEGKDASTAWGRSHPARRTKRRMRWPVVKRERRAVWGPRDSARRLRSSQEGRSPRRRAT